MVKGVVSSEDLLLYFSREALQQLRLPRVIKKNLAEVCLEMLAEFPEKKDVCMKFWEQFGKCIKLGVHVDFTNRTKVAELPCSFSPMSGAEQISPKEYVDRMKEGQNDILTGNVRPPLLAPFSFFSFPGVDRNSDLNWIEFDAAPPTVVVALALLALGAALLASAAVFSRLPSPLPGLWWQPGPLPCGAA
eukprot:CAMPEP_0171161190 /NCGR_PEP_ID=MMETSP0790-20130122/3946_1 /TAXON_ID=2925 /ORGANISM="Alexandrium catenella, Strain OF101" /LENGTH=189 /DNA_ID=CAMNT_0011625749 /DNA_START=102 /DNA_END=669 /DNA_ORIENTATION=+